MATLDSSSTQAEIEAEFADTVSWFEDRDLDKARRFVTACGFMIRRGLRAAQKGDERLEFDLTQLKTWRDEAATYVASRTSPHDGGLGVLQRDLRYFR